MLSLILTTLISAWAQPHMDLLWKIEWKGSCRKAVNEANQEVKQPYLRLQSVYSFKKHNLIWWVKTFNDTKCTELHDATKYTLACSYEADSEYANCKETKQESSTDGVAWTEKPAVDHAGQTDLLTLKVKATKYKGSKLMFTTVGESEEPETEVLSR